MILIYLLRKINQMENIWWYNIKEGGFTFPFFVDAVSKLNYVKIDYLSIVGAGQTIYRCENLNRLFVLDEQKRKRSNAGL